MLAARHLAVVRASNSHGCTRFPAPPRALSSFCARQPGAWCDACATPLDPVPLAPGAHVACARVPAGAYATRFGFADSDPTAGEIAGELVVPAGHVAVPVGDDTARPGETPVGKSQFPQQLRRYNFTLR